MNGLSALSIGFQALSTGSGALKSYTEKNHVTSRRFATVSLASITADYFLKYSQHPTNANMVGALNFGTVTARSALILYMDLDSNNRQDKFKLNCISWSAFGLGAALCFGSQILFSKGLYSSTLGVDPWTLLPLAGSAMGAWADTENDMAKRRKRFIIMGSCTAFYGLITQEWGLVGKNLVSDIGASIVRARSLKEPLLPSIRPSLKKIGRLARRLALLDKAA